MKKILLTRGKIALVDDEDYRWLSQWSWCYSKGVALRRCRVKEVQYTGTLIYMHREIIGLLSKNEFDVDHIDGNSLNNQKHNLRKCTHQQNSFNNKGSKYKIGYKGVYPPGPRDKGFQAKIMINSKSIHIGVFSNEEDAAVAYNKKAIELFGEYANINTIISIS